MKRNLTIIVGLLLIAIFVLLLFVFQVRTTEVAVVTTFGKATQPVTTPGVYFAVALSIPEGAQVRQAHSQF